MCLAAPESLMVAPVCVRKVVSFTQWAGALLFGCPEDLLQELDQTLYGLVILVPCAVITLTVTASKEMTSSVC